MSLEGSQFAEAADNNAELVDSLAAELPGKLIAIATPLVPRLDQRTHARARGLSDIARR